MKYRKIATFLILFIVLTQLSSCVPEGYQRHESGFFSGLWHGFIIVFSVIGKMFGVDIGIYAVHNSGFFYWLGFIIGLGSFGGGGSRAASKRK